MRDRRPFGPSQVSALARAHAPRAARIAMVGLVVVALLSGTGALIRFAEHRVNHSPSQPVTPPHIEHPTSVWTGTSPFGPLTGLAAFGNTLYAGGSDGLLAYPLPCPAQAYLCKRAWHDPVSDGPISAPAANGDEVYAGSAHGHVYAFPAACNGPFCVPLWRGDAGAGSVSAPGVNDDFVYVASTSVYAFPARCGVADLTCPPAWIGAIPGRSDAGAPAVGAGLVVVGWHEGSRGGLVAFPAVCLDTCAPVWTADTGGPPSPVTLSADTAYVVARGALIAFPLSCRGICSPAWVGPFLMGLRFAGETQEAPILDRGRAYVGGADGRLWVFPASCDSGTCGAIASVRVGKEPLLSPVARNGIVYVASAAGTLTAIPESCVGVGAGAGTAACDGPWSDTLGHAVRAGPDATDDVLYIGDDAGTVHAYAIPRS